MSGLDEAWAEAEAALPEGWAVIEVTRKTREDWLDTEWDAAAAPDRTGWLGAPDFVYATGPTPTAALRALAAKLRGAADKLGEAIG